MTDRCSVCGRKVDCLCPGNVLRLREELAKVKSERDATMMYSNVYYATCRPHGGDAPPGYSECPRCKEERTMIKPCHDYLLVEPLDEPTTTAAGLTIPESARRSQFTRATVIAQGPGINTPDGYIKIPACKGHIVMYPGPKAYDAKPGLKLVRFSDVVAVQEADQ